MAIIYIPEILRTHTYEIPAFETWDNTLIAALHELVQSFPQIHKFLFKTESELQEHLHIFVNQTDVQGLSGLSTELRENDEVDLVFAIAGG